MYEVIVIADCNDGDYVTERTMFTPSDWFTPTIISPEDNIISQTPALYVQILRNNMHKCHHWLMYCTEQVGKDYDFYSEIVPNNIMCDGEPVSVSKVTVLFYDKTGKIYEL